MHNLQIKFSKETREFTPGERLQGELRWELPDKPERIELRLLWATAGRGVPELGVVELVRSDRLEAQGSHPFDLQLPPFPFTYEGRLMRLAWCLEAVAIPGNVTAREEFILAPDRKKIVLHSSSMSGILRAAA